MHKGTFKEILDLAKSKEEGSFARYTTCAQKAKNAVVRDFFTKLAKEDEGHLAKLNEISKRGISHFKEHNINDLKISEFLVDVSFYEDMSLQDAILYAIKAEKHAIEFYGRLVQMMNEEEIKKMFNVLKEEEMGHKRHLEEVYEDAAYQFF